MLVLLPLELLTGYLRGTTAILASAVEGFGGFEYESPLRGVLAAAMAPVERLGASLLGSQGGQAAFLIVVSTGLIFTALLLLVRVMRSACLACTSLRRSSSCRRSAACSCVSVWR